MRTRILFFLVFFLISCFEPEKHEGKEKNDLSYTKNFEITDYSGCQRVIVHNPWQKSQGESFSYILTSDPESLPDSLQACSVIKTPVEKVITFSSTHVGFISALGKSSSIVGVSGKGFISDTIVRINLEKKTCLDIGFSPNIDFESILLLKPDLVFLYGLDPSVLGLVERLKEVGIQSVLVAEFLEDHPLGKAEWVRFFSAFYSSGQTGDSIFREVRLNYISWKDSVAEITRKPSVLVGLPWKDTWYMAGGKSFTARFIEDAGGKYLWSDNLNTDFIPLDLESVFQRALHAEIWINTGNAGNKSDILSVDQRFQHVPAFQSGELYNNNLRLNATGGNDFWESGAVRPDWVLRDLISIFHPAELGKHEFYYYRKLE